MVAVLVAETDLNSSNTVLRRITMRINTNDNSYE